MPDYRCPACDHLNQNMVPCERVMCYGCKQPFPTADPVDHPAHYTDHPSGVECIQITEHMNFNLGNAVKYIWRAALKGKQRQDLEKAAWYINRELERTSNE